MSKLKDTIDRPLTGCFLLAAVLQDRLFKLHTEDSYYRPFPAKLQSFRTVEEVFSIPSLDFLFAVSSIATFGNPGQSNYASANSIVDELTEPYPNAFSLIAPAILDTSMIVGGVNLEVASRLSHLESWGMSSQALFNYIEDGLLKLFQAPFWLYVHQLKFGLAAPSREEVSSSILELLLRFLDISRDDFLPEVPFTSYGLDSLSAVRLSVALQPSLSITQLQLLGHMTFVELEARVHRQAEEMTPDHAFMQLQERFSTTLWAIQTTPETPLDSVATTAKYYVEQIKLARPRGPYCIGGFSASGFLTFEVARLLESEGKTIAQLAMLDHFPTLFASPSFQLDDLSLASGQPSMAVVKTVVQSICECYLRDNAAARHDIGRELRRAVEDLPVREYIDDYMAVVKRMTAGVTRFLVDNGGGPTIPRPRPSGASCAA
ncbi:hypothetical protein DFH08DRAFT_1082134 [Mycena albidolilacea]|uniref:Polyketide synthase n=1 Tax=Mycena albidolilacea TaxID=1033008 RepID=A0AAD7EN51_9AGAR|nr:hypothetical protein DFH08DRAFT_1082134 [Mycena albidolilacea]